MNGGKNMVLNQNEFVSDLVNLALVLRVNKTNDKMRMNELIEQFTDAEMAYGDQKGFITVDTLTVQDYAEESSLLKINKPTVNEQFISTTDKKKIAVTLSRFVMRGAFTGEGSLETAIAVILSMLEQTKLIYTYKKIIQAFEAYTPKIETQTVAVEITDSSTLTGEEKAAVERQNAINMYLAERQTAINMQAPTRKYNDLAYEEAINADDLVYLRNAEYEAKENAYAYATLLNSDKLNNVKLYDKSILLPTDQLKAETKENVIGWLVAKGKYVVIPRFTIARGFEDASNLMSHNYLHFWLCSGFVDGLPAVKFVKKDAEGV